MPDFRTSVSQGPWTRIRPLQRDEVDLNTRAAMSVADITWNLRSNLAKVMAYMPRMLQTATQYVNSFIFDPPAYSGDVQEAAFIDRFLKELVISKTSLLNRSRYSVTHHALIGMLLYEDAGRAEEAHRKYLHLHDHEHHSEMYTERERIVLNYTTKVVTDPHSVSDHEFSELRRVFREHNLSEVGATSESEEDMARLVDCQIVELTWLIGHFCSLNRWFTVLQVPDEGTNDEDDFLSLYDERVPADIRERNEIVLQVTR